MRSKQKVPTRKQEELFLLWLTALTSGEYQQGNGGLRTANEYCCLGVYCDVSGEGKWLEIEPDGQVVFEYAGQADAGLIPMELATKLGWTELGLPMHMELPDQWPLANMNDNEQRSFDDIAKAVGGSRPLAKR